MWHDSIKKLKMTTSKTFVFRLLVLNLLFIMIILHQLKAQSPSGIVVDTSVGNGIEVNNPQQSGVIIANPLERGIHVVGSGSDGVWIENAGDIGLDITDPGDIGLRIVAPGEEGIVIDNTEKSGLIVKNSTLDGIEVNHSQRNGIRVFGSFQQGIHVNASSLNGILVENSSAQGLIISESGTHGMSINNPGGAGIEINDAGGVGLMVRNSTSNGFYMLNGATYGGVISGVGFQGLRIQNTGEDGLFIFNPGDDGIQVNHTSSNGITKHAAYFNGHVYATNIAKGAGSFKIDHPLDPENKYLYHSFVESPDMMNIYNGNVILDADGQAVVNMPDWFESLNRQFRYQLTSIGSPGPNLYISKKISNLQFSIAGGTPGSEVSWMVTGIRQDALAESQRIQVEVDKPDELKGSYLHAEAWAEKRALNVKDQSVIELIPEIHREADFEEKKR